MLQPKPPAEGNEKTMSEKKLFLGDGGTIQAAAQAAYEAAFAAAQAAYDAVMCDAPPKPAILAKPSAERAEFVARATAAFEEIEGPARAKRDAAWVPGPRPADYSIGLGEAED